MWEIQPLLIKEFPLRHYAHKTPFIRGGLWRWCISLPARGAVRSRAPQSITSPLAGSIALQHHNLMVIPKGSEWQVVYDAAHPTKRIVHLSRNIITLSEPDGSFTVQLLRPSAGDLELMEKLNRPFNTLLPSKSTFRASAVDYTNSKHFRQYLRKWGAAAHLAWIDCSAACRWPPSPLPAALLPGHADATP